jgi:NAD(P) transhydrogenase subunit alpha
MIIFVPKELDERETRCALNPDSTKKLIGLGFEVQIESNTGLLSDHPDADYETAGAKIVTDRGAALGAADYVLRVNKPPENEVASLKKGAMHVSFLDPFNEGDLIKKIADSGATGVSLEMIPRTTLAQKMDAISSQANIAGYEAVIIAAERLNKILPMMMTPAGTISPAKVFIIGVGVAGLQAIATAKRMGARVEAFDTRPVVEEQVKSLGAKFVKIDLGEMGQTDQGYAKELTPEQIKMQQAGMAKVCAQADIVITTAKLFGRPAPIIVTKEMVAGMRNGSIIVDLAAETGGNVDGTVLYEEVITDNGVRIIGIGNLEGRKPTHASQVFASNMANFIDHFWDKEEKKFNFDLEDELLKGCVITHDGKIVHERFAPKSDA